MMESSRESNTEGIRRTQIYSIFVELAMAVLVLGFCGFSLFAGYLRLHPASAIVSLILLVLYGGILWKLEGKLKQETENRKRGKQSDAG